MSEISSDIISAIDKTTLRQALSLIACCDLFVGPDSSLLHVASCLKVVSIGLYGPTPVDYIYPYFHRQNVIMAQEVPDGMSCLTDPLSCVCRKTPQPSACMENISVEEVLRAVRQKLQQNHPTIKTRDDP